MRHSNALFVTCSPTAGKLFTKISLALKSTLSCSVTNRRNSKHPFPPKGEISRAENKMDDRPPAVVSCRSQPQSPGCPAGRRYQERLNPRRTAGKARTPDPDEARRG